METHPFVVYLISLYYYQNSNHKLPIEVGRWEGVPLNERKCLNCYTDIGDEFHYLFKCSHFTNERILYLKPYFYRRPNILKLRELYSSSNRKTLINLAKFVELIMKTLSKLLSYLHIEIIPHWIRSITAFYILTQVFRCILLTPYK